ncbi:MAG: FtsX-like permease family protein [Planctomycetota bacterium]
MYQALLTRRYLFRKLMPLLAAVAVALCTAMVLIVWSVMGGFLDRFIAQGRVMVGDVAIMWPTAGFAHYDDLVERLEADPEILAATPMIESFGVLVMPGDRRETVIVKGIDGPGFAEVTSYADTVWWKPLDEPLARDTKGEDVRTWDDWFLRNRAGWERDEKAGLSLTKTDAEGRPAPAVVLGIELTGANIRDPRGWYDPGAPLIRRGDGSSGYNTGFILDDRVTLHVVPLDAGGRAIEMVTRVFPVANEFQTGLYEVDSRAMFVRLDALQEMLGLDEARRLSGDVESFDPLATTIDPRTGEERFAAPPAEVVDPARVTTVLVRATDRERDPNELGEHVRSIYAEFAKAHPGQVPPAEGFGAIMIRTWEDMNRTMIEAVRKETGLVLFIFGFVSLTAVFLVLAIFWSMVSEKTRDVGILRALGAGRAGVAWLWIRYGIALGVVGSMMGGVLAYFVVSNLNEIHAWMGRALNIRIWDPSVYYFTEIPGGLEPTKAAIVLGAGVLASAFGAALPAVRAAWMDPVRALRFE